MLERALVAPILPWFSGFVFVLGTVVGSFLNVVIWRLPRGESLSHPGSHCPRCGHAIRPWENIPIVSWLWLRARCSQCHLPISVRYPLIELANGLLYLVLWWRLWHSVAPLSALWGYLFLGSALLAAALIDVEHFLIPDRITFVGILVGIGLAAGFPETHLGTGLTGLPGSDQLVTAAVLDRLGSLGLAIRARPRLASAVDAGLGVALGYLILRLLLEAGRRLWGRVRVRVDVPVTAVFDRTGVRLEGEGFEATWDDLLVYRDDVFRAQAVSLTPARPEDGPGPTELRITRSAWVVGGRAEPRATAAPLTAVLSAWEYPRDVLGHGDLKLLAMVGAFLGPDATVFVLMVGAFLGLAWGGSRALRQPARRREPLPFGPFLALGAVVWVLGGEAFVDGYGRWLNGVLA